MIKIEDLKKTYDRRTRNANTVLHGMSFELPDRGFVCILGSSGCGKTSLLNAIGGLDEFDSGKIITDSARITRSGSRAMENERNANFGYIFQNYYLLSDHSAAYNIYIGMHSMPISKKEKMQRVKYALEKVDMLRYRKRPVGQLSGGQQQRIAIARAIARNPKVIFADEPTGNLDEANTMNICTILKEISRDSLVVMVTHEERIARFFADRIITLDDGRIVSDSTDWSRGTMDAGEKDAVYSGEYEESSLDCEKLSLRILAAENTDPVDLTVITEKDRIIIKVNDPRVVLCSDTNSSPRLIEGKRPVLNEDSFKKSETVDEKPINIEQTASKARKKGLGIKFLLREAKFLVSGKKLGKIGAGIFIVLLSLMISLSVSDIVTVSHIDPEDFITTDSHIINFTFNRGKKLPSNAWQLKPYIASYMTHLESSGLDFDYVTESSLLFEYKDSTVPQFGDLAMSFSGSNYVNISRLEESTIIYGRMPERSDEIVVDRWIIDKLLEEDGIIQNIIPNSEYLVGKRLSIEKRTYSPLIVGICDSGQPNIYMSKETMLAFGVGGMEVISFSEFCEITGYDKLSSLGFNECIALSDTAGGIYLSHIGKRYNLDSERVFLIKDAIPQTGKIITAKFVVSDARLKSLYREMIEYAGDFSIWCENKSEMLEFVNSELPESLDGMLEIRVEDKYASDYQAYQDKTLAKVDARTIVTATVLLLSLVMLYLMQRSKINERMDIVAVYRLLGIPKRNLMFIFAAESVALTLKYSIPTVLVTWLGINIASSFEELGFTMLFPFWAVGVTLASILAVRLIIAVLPILRLLSQPPARLAAKYDF